MSKFTKLRGWLKARRSRQPDTQATPTDFDLFEAARGDLWAKAADNPRLARLLTEIERGRERAARMSCEDDQAAINDDFRRVTLRLMATERPDLLDTGQADEEPS